jgi:hypothetical protein
LRIDRIIITRDPFYFPERRRTPGEDKEVMDASFFAVVIS